MGTWPGLACPEIAKLCLWPDPAPLSLQVARAGRFGTKGLAITFVSDENDAKILNDVQDRFEVNVAELPEEIDISTYSKWLGQEGQAGACVGAALLSSYCVCVCLTVEQSR